MDDDDYQKQKPHQRSRVENISEDEALELIQAVEKDTFCRLYLPSGKVFLNVVDGQWVLAFWGEYTNEPANGIGAGIVWKPAQGTYRLNFEKAMGMAVYLWNFLSGSLEDGQRLMESKSPKNRTASKVLLAQHSPERGQIFMRYIDYGKKQSTIFAISQHHALELYLGLLAAFRAISKDYFENMDIDTSIPGMVKPPLHVLETIHVNGRPLEILLRENKIMVRDITSQNKIESVYSAHATMFAHMFNSFLCRNMDRNVRFGERVTVTLPHVFHDNDDIGRINVGEFVSDFSKRHAQFNVALHMASFAIIDGLPVSLMR